MFVVAGSAAAPLRYNERTSMKRDKREIIYILAILVTVASVIVCILTMGFRYSKAEKARASIDTTTVQAEYEDTWAQTIKEEDL